MIIVLLFSFCIKIIDKYRSFNNIMHFCISKKILWMQHSVQLQHSFYKAQISSPALLNSRNSENRNQHLKFMDLNVLEAKQKT